MVYILSVYDGVTRQYNGGIIQIMMIDLGFPLISIDRELTILLIALLFDGTTRLLLPDFRDRMAPIGGIIASVSRFMQQKLNRDHRESGTLFVRGMIALIILLGLSSGAAFVIDMLISSHPRGQILSVLVVFSCLSVTAPWSVAPEIIKALGKKNIIVTDLLAILKRRRVIRDIPVKTPDKYSVARVTIEAVGHSFSRGFMNVAFWYCVPTLLGYSGIIMMLMATAITEMNRVIAQGNLKTTAFETPFSALDTIIHYIPSRLAGILLWLAMLFAPNLKPFIALKTMLQQSHKHKVTNSAWTTGLLAGGLNIALASGNAEHQWLGSKTASAKAGVADIRRALNLHYVTFIIALLIVSCVLLLSLGIY